MKGPSKEVRRALDALDVGEPSAEDEARVRESLEKALGIAIPVAAAAAVTTTATATATTTTTAVAAAQAVPTGAIGSGLSLFSGAMKVALVVTAASAGVAAYSVVSRGGDKPALAPALPITQSLPQRAAPVDVVVEPAPLPPPSPPLDLADPPLPKPLPRMRGAETGKQAQAPTPPPAAPDVEAEPPPATEETYALDVETNFPLCDGPTETRTAAKARQLLVAHRPLESVWLLGAYQRQCPSGHWSDEAWTVRLISLCQLDRYSEAGGLLEWFYTEYPERRAAVLAELDGACPEEVLERVTPSIIRRRHTAE